MPTTFVIRVDLPPRGELELSGNGSNPTGAQTNEEQALRDAYVESLTPVVTELLSRPLHRSGNVSRVELLGGGVWSQLNHFLLLVELDIGEPALDLDRIAPPGSRVEVVGNYQPIESWAGRSPSAAPAPTGRATRPAANGHRTTPKENTMTASPRTYSAPYGARSHVVATRGLPDGPLSPDGFGEGPGSTSVTPQRPAETTGTGIVSDADKATLRRVRALVARAREDLGSSDSATVAGARQRLAAVVSYLTGYLDAKGIRPPSNGFTALFPAAQRSTDEQLDAVEALLAALTAPGTRFFIDFSIDISWSDVTGLVDGLLSFF